MIAVLNKLCTLFLPLPRSDSLSPLGDFSSSTLFMVSGDYDKVASSRFLLVICDCGRSIEGLPLSGVGKVLFSSCSSSSTTVGDIYFDKNLPLSIFCPDKSESLERVYPIRSRASPG